MTGTAISTAQTDVATAQSYASTAKTVYDSDAMKTVREGVNMLVESLPGLVKALDEVAKLHPFIASPCLLVFASSDGRTYSCAFRIGDCILQLPSAHSAWWSS